MKQASNTTLKKHAKIYFWCVGLLSLFWIALFFNSQTEWKQVVKETLKLSPKLMADQESFYNSRIDPIFEKYCVACHDGNKDKGHLRLDSFRQLSFSGRSGADLTEADNNLLLQRMTLPLTNRLVMPPFGRERHTEQELELIKLWLSKGGSGQLTEEDFPDAPPKARIIKFKDIDWQIIDKLRAPSAKKLKNLQTTFPDTLHYLARTSHMLSVNFSHLTPSIGDAELLELDSISTLIVELDLSNMAVSDGSIDLLQTMQALQKIKLVNTDITEQTLDRLLTLPNLKKVFVDAELVNAAIKERFDAQEIFLFGVKRR